jgi:hypothetical protein
MSYPRPQFQKLCFWNASLLERGRRKLYYPATLFPRGGFASLPASRERINEVFWKGKGMTKTKKMDSNKIRKKF